MEKKQRKRGLSLLLCTALFASLPQAVCAQDFEETLFLQEQSETEQSSSDFEIVSHSLSKTELSVILSFPSDALGKTVLLPAAADANFIEGTVFDPEGNQIGILEKEGSEYRLQLFASEDERDQPVKVELKALRTAETVPSWKIGEDEVVFDEAEPEIPEELPAEPAKPAEEAETEKPSEQETSYEEPETPEQTTDIQEEKAETPDAMVGLASVSSKATKTFSELQRAYPAGKYWAHKKASNHQNTVDLETHKTTTSNDSIDPCNRYTPISNWYNWSDDEGTSGDYVTNHFDGYPWCDGYSRLIYSKYHGFKDPANKNPQDRNTMFFVKSNNADAKHYFGTKRKGMGSYSSLKQGDLKPGDRVQIRVGSYIHSAVVTGSSSTSVTVTDANMDLKGGIRWGATFSYGSIFGYSTPRHTFTLKFNPMGGDGDMSDQTIRYGLDNQNIKANAFTKQDYKFKGWYLRHNANSSKTQQYIYKNSAGTFKQFVNDSAAKAVGYSRVLYSNKSGISTTTIVDKTVITCEAQWERKSFTIHYDPGKGGAGKMADQQIVTGKSTQTLANAFTKTGYTFAGWHVRRASGEWIYTKTVNGQLQYKTFPENSEAAKKEGYKIALYKNKTSVSRTSTIDGEIVTFVAQWTPNTYTVKYDPGDAKNVNGQGTMNDATCTYDKAVALRRNTFTRPGYAFAGWRAHLANGSWLAGKKGSSGTSGFKAFSNESSMKNAGYDYYVFSDGEMIKNLTAKNKDSITFIAQWNKLPDVQRISMHRLYNPNSGEHFYTADENEKKYLSANGWQYEGIGWIAPARSSHPVYRLYNGHINPGDHHYTTDANEKNFLVSQGWTDEGIGWYSDYAQGETLWRQYNPNAKAGSHNYTTSVQERDYLVSLGWKDEGIAWYGMSR